MNTTTKVAAAVAATGLAALAWMGPEPATHETKPVTVELNGSSDGRYHTCGYVTEDGVTEYLDEYIERCGNVTP